MKVLEVQSLISSIDQTYNSLNNLSNQMKDVEASIKLIVLLEQSLKGNGGQAIRAFYQEQHLSFIFFYLDTVNRYKEFLQTLKNEVLALEPDENGFIRESFLQNELKEGLERAKIHTVEMTNNANNIIDNVSDIVSLPRLQDEHFLQQMKFTNENIDQTLENLHTFDVQQTKNLSVICESAERMKTYIQKIEMMFQKGNITVDTYNKQLIEPIKPHDNVGAKEIHSEEDDLSSEIEIDFTTPFTGTNLYATTAQGVAVAHTAYRSLHGHQVIRTDGKVRIKDNGKPIQRKKNPPGRPRAKYRIYSKSYIESQMKRGNYIKEAEFSGIKGAVVGGLKNKLTPLSIGIDVANDTISNIKEGAPLSKTTGDILGSVAVGVGTTALAAGITISALPVTAGVTAIAAAGFVFSTLINVAAEGYKLNMDKNKDGKKDSVKDLVKHGFGEGIRTVAGWLK